MQITIRRFNEADIPNKVKWINDPRNNGFLHYDLPLEADKTLIWFEKNMNREDRYDAVIEADGIPCGLIGLLSIDRKNSKAEYYVSMGEAEYKGKGISTEASRLLLAYAFGELGLNRVYLYTEVENIPAQRLFEKLGFTKEGRVCNDLFSRGKFVDRFLYAMHKENFERGQHPTKALFTPVQHLGAFDSNQLFVKREDMIPFSFGGNKARKAALFFEEIDGGDYDCIVTYGSSSSNHCRVVANMAAARNFPCYIISPEEASEGTYNSCMMELFGAEITVCPVNQVSDTIAHKLQQLQAQGFRPYFIAGGGHGNIGTQAYVDCYEEICQYERESGVYFDYIFHASGTGTTQAGLICGQLIGREDRKIIGVSIARTNPKGRNVVLESVKDYLCARGISVEEDEIEEATIFNDQYIDGGYGIFSAAVDDTIKRVLIRYGIPMDSTYTGKAFAGMQDFIKTTGITNKNILFIHTGGAPLFFDFLNKNGKENVTP